MQRMKTALLLSTLSLAVSACGEQRIVESIPTPAERLICELAGTRPTLTPEKAIDWSQIRTVDAAKLAHESFVKELRVRENVVAGYILKLEGNLFVCFNNMQWRREFEADLARRSQ